MSTECYQRKSLDTRTHRVYPGAESSIPWGDKLEQCLFPDSIHGIRLDEPAREKIRLAWAAGCAGFTESEQRGLTFENGYAFRDVWVAGKEPVLRLNDDGRFEVEAL